jgi:benzoyl-CoA reductase/2-hydroxyglutaryl-CoA dehydratase subunit BcrC/BadD/HgdB
LSGEKEHKDFLDELKERFIDRLSPSMMRSRLFWKTVEKLSLSRLNRPEWKADRISLAYFLGITRDAYFRRAPVVWSNLLVPPELILGLGCIPFYPEMAAAVVAAIDMAPRFIDRATELGFSPDGCSYHRCMLGCAAEGFLPEPDLLVALNYPCDSAPLSFGYASGMFDAERIVIDVPVPGRPSSRALLAEQLKEVGFRLAELSGVGEKDMMAGLSRSLDLSNQALHFLKKVEEIRKRDDCILDGKDAMGNLSVLAGCLGSEAGVEFYRMLAEELEQRGTPGAGSRRIMWMHLKPWYSQRLFDVLDAHGVRIVCEEYTHSCWEPMDPGNPFDSLAQKVGGHFLIGPVERRSAHLTRIAKEYRVDGAIHYNHWGCRQSCAGAVQIKRDLLALGIPTLLIDGDCVDPREYQEGQISTRLEAFLESLN